MRNQKNLNLKEEYDSEGDMDSKTGKDQDFEAEDNHHLYIENEEEGINPEKETEEELLMQRMQKLKESKPAWLFWNQENSSNEDVKDNSFIAAIDEKETKEEISYEDNSKDDYSEKKDYLKKQQELKKELEGLNKKLYLSADLKSEEFNQISKRISAIENELSDIENKLTYDIRDLENMFSNLKMKTGM